VARPRRPIKALLAAGLVSLFLAAPPAVRPAPEQRSLTLSNGLRVFLYSRPDVPLLNLAAAVEAGTRDESEGRNGLLHLLEHVLLFRSAGLPGGKDFASGMRRQGIYFNGFTGRDYSLFEMSAPPERASVAFRALAGLVFDFDVRDDDMEREKEVILEEISRLREEPLRFGLELAAARLFQGHPYGRPVHGREEDIARVTRDDLLAFHRAYFSPSRCVLVAVGSLPVEVMERAAREAFAALRTENELAPANRLLPVPSFKENPVIHEYLDVKDAHVFVAVPAPDFNSPRQFAFDVLCEALGSGPAPLLLLALQRSGHSVAGLNMFYFPNALGGEAVAYCRTDDKSSAGVARDMASYLQKEVRSENFSPDDLPPGTAPGAFDFLSGARNGLALAAFRAEEEELRLAESMARFLLLNRRAEPPPYLEAVRSVRSGDLRRAAAEWFSRQGSVTLVIHPLPGQKRRPVPRSAEKR